MRVLYVSLVCLAVATQAAKPKDKRTTVDPNPQYQQYSQAQYSQAAAYAQAAAREQPEYITAQTQQQYYQPEAAQAQAVSYQPVAKYATAAAAPAQKYAYTPQPKQQIQYSSAADVSSFSYSSPIVSYNNLGLLQQIAGKSASSQDVPVTYSAQSSKVEYQQPQHQVQPQAKVQYISAPKVQYTSAPVQYTAASKQSYTSAAKSQAGQQYSAAPIALNAYSASNAAPNYEEIYQQIAQKAAYSAPEAQQQASAYQQSAPQKVVYQQSPRVIYQLPKGQEEAYSSPSQQYTYQLPQEYESQSQAASQLYYSQQAAGAQHQQSPQYYTLSSQSQKGNVQYA